MTVMVGGWGATGTPDLLIAEAARLGLRDLTVIVGGSRTVEPMTEAGAISHLITSFGSYPGRSPTPPAFARRTAAGELTTELCSQGVLVERIRAGGAGIPAFYVEERMVGPFRSSPLTHDIDGVPCVLERALRADVALVQASIGDRGGNLAWRNGERNYNEAMAFAADLVIAEVHELYEIGWMAPEHVMVPGFVVDRLVDASGRELPG